MRTADSSPAWKGGGIRNDGAQWVPKGDGRVCCQKTPRHAARMDEWSARMLTSLNRPGGAVAQLGARLDGIEEVVGSNPIGSTKFSFFQ